MIRRTTRSTRTDTLCPNTQLFRSEGQKNTRAPCLGAADERPVLLGRHFHLHEQQRIGAEPGARHLRRSRVEIGAARHGDGVLARCGDPDRSEEHTSELQSLMRISYAVFCLKKKKTAPTAMKLSNKANSL